MTTHAEEQRLPSRRERARAATLAEIKTTALAVMRAQGNTDLRFTDIARAMGLTPPALYRYYPDREALLTDLIADGYRDLAVALAVEVDTPDTPAPRAHLLRVAEAFRRWALGDPQRFTLIFGQPIPGYAAPVDGPTVEAAKEAMANLAAVVMRAAHAGTLGPPLITEVTPAVRAFIDADKAQGGAVKDVPEDTHQALMHAWAALHGGVCLETYGHLDFCPEETRDALFVSLVDLVATFLGL